jgi:prenylcysteine oxidase/farnesylcysteine lyase
VNYGQNIGVIHGLETMVCMAIEGAMQIQGGNWRIFDRMLKASGADLHLNTSATSIEKISDKYTLNITTTQSGEESNISKGSFDAVILAAPLQFSGLKIQSGLVKHLPDEIPYVKLHVTLFASPLKLRPAYFGMKEGDEVPSTILTTTSPEDDPSDRTHIVGKAGFFSISTLRNTLNPTTGKNEYIYKIFSPRTITSSFLKDLFGMECKYLVKFHRLYVFETNGLRLVDSDTSKPSTIASKDLSWYYPFMWHSYPYEYPRVTFEDIELARGLYYTSGIESFISTMETSALMGMNVAQLILDDFLEIVDSKPVEDEGVFKIQDSKESDNSGPAKEVGEL